jgi:hypothetical protein
MAFMDLHGSTNETDRDVKAPTAESIRNHRISMPTIYMCCPNERSSTEAGGGEK